jgi:RNA-splicing ligase RtcB
MTENEYTHLSGEYTDAIVMLPERELEDGVIDQIQTMIDHEAFTNKVRIMPDCHVGKGSVIGFTMPLGDKVVPVVVGVDVSCGMTALKLGDELPVQGEELDKRVRDRVPMGYGPEGLEAPERDYYHVKNQFPWNEVNTILEQFIEEQDGAWVDEMQAFADNSGYDIDYFKELVNERAGKMSGYFDMNTAISSLGTLGAGNHFVEIGQSDKTGDYWVVVHSGSRGLGANTAQFWQQRASKLRNVEHARETLRDLPDEYLNYTKFTLDEVSDEDLLDWLQGAKGESFVDYEALKAEYSDTHPERIESIGNELKTAIPDDTATDDESLDYLDGSEAAGYLIDMIFLQKYAEESRTVMAHSTAKAIGVEPTDMVESPHNLISSRDGIIRKGATAAYEGERVIVPLNMRDGILMVEGKSNEKWNNSVAHGAGRVMSRRQADDEFNEEELRAEMEEAGAFATKFPTDEAPGAYKRAELIEDAIEPTATIVDRFDVVHSFKAE